MNEPHLQQVVIGGPSRCGKTLLGHGLARRGSSLFWFPLEGHLYKKIKGLRASERSRVLKYLQTPRNVGADKKSVQSPDELIDQDITSQISYRSTNDSTDAQLISRLLDAQATKQEATGWIVADIHAEFWFEKLKKQIPALKLLLVYRNPVESVCAGIYWRTYPARMANARSIVAYRSHLWALSAWIGLRLQDKYPDSVKIIRANHLGKHDWSDLNTIRTFLSDSAIDPSTPLYDEELWFQRSAPTREFVTPDHTHRNLLSEKELEKITQITNQIAKSIDATYCDQMPRLTPLFLDRCILHIARLISYAYPPAAKWFLDSTLLRLAPKMR